MSVSISGAGSISGLDQGFNVTGGQVGVGTDNPGHLLDVYNNAGSDCLRLNVNGGAGGSNKQNAIRFSVDGVVKAHMGLAVDAGRLISGSIANDFCLKGLGSNNILFATNSSEKLRIKTNGDVFIGNIAEANDNGVNSNYRTLTLADTTNGAQLHLRGQSPKLFLDVTSSGNGEIYYDTGDLRILSGEPGNAGSTERLRITAAGDMGLGTNSPTSFGPTFQISGTDPALLLQDTATAVDYYGMNIGNGHVTSWFDDSAYFAIGTASGISGASYSEKLRIRSDGDVVIGPNDLESQLGSRRRLVVCDTTNGALVHIRGQSPAAFFDVSSGGTGRVYCDNSDFTIYPGVPNSEGTESIRVKSDGQLQQRGFVNLSSNRRLNGTLSAGTYTFGTVTNPFAGILYITGTHNNGHSTRIYIINKSTNGSGVTLVGDGNDYSPARTDVSLSGNNLQVQVYYGNKPVIHMVALRGTYTHTLAE